MYQKDKEISKNVFIIYKNEQVHLKLF